MGYRWNLLPRLAAAIERGRREHALALWDELAVEIADGCDGDPRIYVLRCAQCLSVCLRAARRAGGPSDRLYDEHLATLKRLSRAATIAAARRRTRAYLADLVETAAPARRSRMERVVAAIVADLRATIERPKALATYADQLELSVGHLSRAFARIAGRPFRDELRRLRDEEAARLLLGTRLPIAEVARRIGLRSASQFIADFRRGRGVTPARFRAERRAR
ncbi:MAG TPA: AraC family transcriptional regulator [Planctomycetota bacterium]|nr:AraC family transcriptional regulator [Planctomycetota bacterium]